MTTLLPRDRLDAWSRDPEAVGLIPSDPPLRRDPWGGIDYDHYLHRGRAERSKAAHAMVRGLARWLKGRLPRRAARR